MSDSESDDISGRIRIDAVCDAFEKCWKSEEISGRPDLREFLDRVTDKHRERLATELLLIDRHYAGLAGGAIGREEYLAKYPELELAISRAFAAEQGTIDSHATVPSGNMPTIDGLRGGENPKPQRIGETVRYFGDYELIDEIARGGMGVVYRAKQISLNREIALKMILSGQIAGDDQIRRFQLEAEAAANLDHPGIVPIYDIGQHEGQHYFSMKLIKGQTLSQLSSALADDRDRALDLVAQIADAVHHAHQRGILHRDLKPGNVLIDEDGTPLITDFGLARDIKKDQQHTASGAVIGTPGFMSPEQAAGKGVTTATDIYSLGAILYQLLCGRPPHQGDSVMATLMSVMNESPAKLRSIDENIHRDLELICLKCLDKDPNKRYASAAEFAGDLRAFKAGEPLRVRPPSIVELARMWLAGNYGSIVWVPVIALAVGITSGFGLWFSTVGQDVAANVTTFDAFPASEKPWMAIGYSKDVGQIAFLGMFAAIMLMGWLTAKWVRTKNTAADLGAGLSVGLLTGLIAFVSGFGLPLILTSSRATTDDLSFVRNFLIYDNQTAAHQELVARYPTLANVNEGQRKLLLVNKLTADYPLDMLRGIWIGTGFTLIIFGVIGTLQTWVAGPLVRNQTAWGARLRYLAFTLALAGASFPVIAELYSRWIIGAGLILDWAFPVGAVIVCCVAMISVVRQWPWPVQLVTTIVGLVFYGMFQFGDSTELPAVPIQRAKVVAFERKLAEEPNRRDLAFSLAAAHADYADVLERTGHDEMALEHYLAGNEILQSWFYNDQNLAVKGEWYHIEINLVARVYYRIAELALRQDRVDLAAEIMNQSTSLISSGPNTVRLYTDAVMASERPAIDFVHVPGDDIGRWWRVREQVRAIAERRSKIDSDSHAWLTSLVDELLTRSDAVTTDSDWMNLREQVRQALLSRQTWKLYGPYPMPKETPSWEIFNIAFGPEALLIGQPQGELPEPSKTLIVYPGMTVWLSDELADVEQVVAYATTTIEVDKDRSIRFMMGSNDGNKVWIDGKLVHAKDVYRDVHPEADSFVVELEAGRHELVMMITQGTSKWGFAMDARDPRGVPLPIWELGQGVTTTESGTE